MRLGPAGGGAGGGGGAVGRGGDRFTLGYGHPLPSHPTLALLRGKMEKHRLYGRALPRRPSDDSVAAHG